MLSVVDLENTHGCFIHDVVHIHAVRQCAACPRDVSIVSFLSSQTSQLEDEGSTDVSVSVLASGGVI